MLCAGRDRNRVSTRRNLPRRAEILCRRRRAQARVVAVPKRNIMRTQNTVNSVGKVLRLQIRKLALLIAQLDIKQVVVDLRYQRLQRNAALHTRRAHQRSHNVARIHKPGRGRRRRNRRLLKKPRRMTRRRNLLDPLPKHTASAHQIRDLRLIQRHFHRARSQKIRCRINIRKLRVHPILPFKNVRCPTIHHPPPSTQHPAHSTSTQHQHPAHSTSTQHQHRAPAPAPSTSTSVSTGTCCCRCLFLCLSFRSEAEESAVLHLHFGSYRVR